MILSTFQFIDEYPTIAAYLLLTIGSFATILVPYIESVAYHGKRLTNYDNKGNKKDKEELTLLHRFNLITIPKYYFTFMYLFSLICCSIPIYYHLKSINFNNNNDNIRHILESLWKHEPLLILFSLHSLRRFLECIYITIYGTSVMHVIGLIVGLVHYGITVLNLANKQLSPLDQEIAYNISLNAYTSLSSLTLSHTKRYVGILLFIFANIMQHRFHIILYRIKYNQQILKKRDENKEEEEDVNSSFKYEVPRGSWFQYCCCPHYTSEILIYISFVCLHPDPASWFMLLWVVSNLTVVAADTLRWYQSHAQLKHEIPMNWSAIIPGIF